MGRCDTCGVTLTTPVYRDGDNWWCSEKCARIASLKTAVANYDAERQHQESLKHAPQPPAEDDE